MRCPWLRAAGLVFGAAAAVATAAVRDTALPAPTQIFSNPSDEFIRDSVHHIPPVHESTIQARRILNLSNIATLSTVFPPATSREQRPHDVADAPIGLMEYYALCGPELYNPTLLGVTLATTMKNAAAGSNVTLSLRYQIPPQAPPTDDPWAYLPANLPRIALIGYLERLGDDVIQQENIRACFLDAHPEALIWEPGSDVHDSWWARLIVQEVYFFGGFGDRARIGWLPLAEWQSISQDEIEQYRLVGEASSASTIDIDAFDL